MNTIIVWFNLHDVLLLEMKYLFPLFLDLKRHACVKIEILKVDYDGTTFKATIAFMFYERNCMHV